jgi:hypothetical protein
VNGELTSRNDELFRLAQSNPWYVVLPGSIGFDAQAERRLTGPERNVE